MLAHWASRAFAATSLLALVALNVGLNSGCGGGQPEAKAPSDEPAPSSRAKKAAASEDEPEPEAEAPARSSCDDGGCFSCGSGTCPSGWYCDEGASGGAACSWLPGCGAKASCACVSKNLGSSCSCSEDGGGPHVSCK
ncbi:MAG: hypothetical protein QM756_36960 [Polyangiaceae bacterium]